MRIKLNNIQLIMGRFLGNVGYERAFKRHAIDQ